MLTRYTSAIAVGALITAVLIYAMQFMVRTEAEVGIERMPVRLPMPSYVFVTPPPRAPAEPPMRPEPEPAPPDTGSLIDPLPDRTAVHTGRLGPPLAPPGAGPAFQDAGPGRWLGGGELLAVAQAQPVYPHAAERRGLEGRVLVEFTVGADGAVRDVRIVESSDRIFERAALTAASRFRYQPRIVDGTPVAVAGVRTEFHFRLTD